jgi:hypothetical protein
MIILYSFRFSNSGRNTIRKIIIAINVILCHIKYEIHQIANRKLIEVGHTGFDMIRQDFIGSDGRRLD